MSAGTYVALRIAIIIALGLFANWAVQRGLRALAARDIFSFGARAIAAKICRWTIVVVTALLVVNQIGISVHALWASLSAVLVLVAVGFIAFWSILSNVSSALLLVIFSPFQIGDEIEILEPTTLDPAKPGIRGRVVDISFLYTTLAEGGDGSVLIRLPNNMFFQKGIRCRKGRKTESLQHNLFHGDAP